MDIQETTSASIFKRVQVKKLRRQPLASRWDSFVATLLPEHAASATEVAHLPRGNFSDESDDDDPVGGVPVY
ncbi:hypothetical protein WJX84_009078 [Apatococcus fuscideae]|uniref:Uncharacterized protein n=1 Tax=Apatococcus fuscideae TaxID=2026836 RepID=A0AAW1RVE8_9CHLO